MTIAKITNDLSVSPQLTEADIAEAAEAGFRSIINNRPDGEENTQPASDALKAAAAGAGIEYRHIPVVAGKIEDADVGAFAKACDELPKPVLAFCRTGTRSISLWSLSMAGEESASALLETAKDAGYDLSSLAPRLEARTRSPLSEEGAKEREAPGGGSTRRNRGSG